MRLRATHSFVVVLLGATLAVSGCAATGPTGPGSTSGAQQNEATPTPPANGKPEAAVTPRDADLTATEFGMSWHDAVQAASERFDGVPVSVSLEWQHPAFAYTVKLLSSEEVYLASFNADSGELSGEWTKPRGGGRAGVPSPVFEGVTVVDPRKAIAAALAAAPGAFEEWELETDDGVLVYEVQIDQGNDDTDVTIDALTGDVLKIDD